ncbi:hypothetical protein HYH03_018517 [Edaphochlamys debaryana]|uniref:Uncharacterized protein n=1 Tax=Edaphochlamys debaryana TaxID=47281 RepID=A0A835XGW2_9CHLO|nr:hypothetical protein HYH03_018517 [Edaphochlamys debaryana]|eukprot:KAG2482558.1 hypothetical protein HYH03_018517 [Edaphochlamys debaryana]
MPPAQPPLGRSPLLAPQPAPPRSSGQPSPPLEPSLAPSAGTSPPQLSPLPAQPPPGAAAPTITPAAPASPVGSTPPPAPRRVPASPPSPTPVPPVGSSVAQPPGGSGGLQPPSAAGGNSSAPPSPAARTPPAASPPPAAAPAPTPPANVSVRNSANIISGGDASSEAEAHPAGAPQQGGGTPGAGVPVPAVAASGPLALLRSATARAAAASRPQSASSPQHLFGASESGAELTAVAAAAVAAAPTGANTGSGAAAAGSPHRSGVRKSQTFNGPAILRRQAADPGADPSSPRRPDIGGELLLPQPSGGPNGADGGLAAAAAMARASPASRRRASLAAVPERVGLAPDMDPAWAARVPSRRASLVLPGPGGVLGAAPAQQPQRPLLSSKAAFLALSGAGAGAKDGVKDGVKEGPWEEGVARRAQSMSAAMMAGAQLRQLARPPSSAFTPPLPPPGPVDAAAAGPSHSSRQAWVDPAAPEPMSSGGGWAAQHCGPLASAPGHLPVAQVGEDAPAGLWQRRTQMPPPMASPSRLGLGLGGRRSTATNDTSVRGGNNTDALPSGPLPSGPLPSGPLPSGPLPSGPLPSGALSPVASGTGHVGHLGDAAGISSSSPQLPHIFIGDATGASADRAASSTGRRSSVLGMLGALSRSLRHAGTSLSGAQRAGSGRRASSVAVTPLPPGTAAVAPAADPHSGSAVDPPVFVGAEAPAAAAAASAGPATASVSGPEDSSVRGPPSRPGSRAQLPLPSSPLASSARWSSIFKRSSLGPEPTASAPAAEPVVLGGPAPASQADLPPGPPPPPPPPPSPPPRSGRVLGMAMTPHTEAPAAAPPLPAAGGGHGDANVGGGGGVGAARGVSIGFSAKGGGTTAEVERAFMLDTEASGVAAVARQGTQDALLETFLPPPPSGSGYARAASELTSLCSSAGRTAPKQSGTQEAAAAAAGGRGAGGDGAGGTGGGTEQLPRRSGSGAAGAGLGSTGTSSGWPASPKRQAALLLDSTPGGHGLPYMSYNPLAWSAADDATAAAVPADAAGADAAGPAGAATATTPAAAGGAVRVGEGSWAGRAGPHGGATPPRPMSGLGVVPLEVSMLRLQGLADSLAAMTAKREAGVTPRKHDE